MWGEFERGMDEKGRIVLPPELRLGLGAEVTLTRAPDGAVLALPANGWSAIEARLQGVSPLDGAALLRRMLSARHDVRPDALGRLIVPRFLREWAGLSTDNGVVLLGLGEHVEIWSRARWHDFAAQFTAENVRIAAKAVGLDTMFGI